MTSQRMQDAMGCFVVRAFQGGGVCKRGLLFCLWPLWFQCSLSLSLRFYFSFFSVLAVVPIHCFPMLYLGRAWAAYLLA